MIMGPIEPLTSHYGELGHYAPSSSGGDTKYCSHKYHCVLLVVSLSCAYSCLIVHYEMAYDIFYGSYLSHRLHEGGIISGTSPPICGGIK